MPYFIRSQINQMLPQSQHLQLQNSVLIPNSPNSHSLQSIESSQYQSDPQNLQLDSQQLLKTLKTLKKLKKISKNKKLTQLKANNKQINNIFKKMSYFFTYRAQQSLKKKLQKNKLRQARKKALKQVGIRKRKNITDLDFQPIIQQNLIKQFSVQLKQTNVQIKQSKCYICKCRYIQVHHFYDSLCITCGDFNFLKRNQKSDLTDFIALVTGARIKIGFEIAIKLLRDGATVIATTRFWKDAFLRYQKQYDYENWAHRLFLIECDFTSSPQVFNLIEMVKSRFKRLDILINNAAQTIVRPKQFYLQQVINETKQIQNLPSHLKEYQPKSYSTLFERYPSLFLPQKQSNQLQLKNDQATSFSSQINKFQEESLISNNQIGHNTRDQFDQPLDKRLQNSWVQKLDDVTLMDCYTTQLVNSIVPFHLISQLKPLMKKKKDQKPSFIINVSSMEGVFNRHGKNYTHPHTNMAKAALNMITRTSARQFAVDSIYMNSADTGWVTQQNPYSFKLQRLIPLDCVDGAMRVLDSIYSGLKTGVYQFGKFLKNYKQSNW